MQKCFVLSFRAFHLSASYGTLFIFKLFFFSFLAVLVKSFFLLDKLCKVFLLAAESEFLMHLITVNRACVLILPFGTHHAKDKLGKMHLS